MLKNDIIVKRFLISKHGTSPVTQEYYAYRVGLLLKYLNKNNINIEDFNQDQLTSFLEKMYKIYKPKGMNHIKAVIKNFIRYTYPRDWIIKFPNLIEICKSQKVASRYDFNQMLSTEDVQILIQKENDPFWKLVYAVQFYGGCRPNEICKLKWKDVSFSDEGIYFSIYSAKNNRTFEKFLPTEYSNYMNELHKISKSEYCFCKIENKPITRHSLYMRLKRHTKKVLPDKKVTPYILRHSIATILYGRAEKGELNEDVVARQLGHSKSMKAVYAHFNKSSLRENARKIYLKPDYTPEQKKEFEKQIADLNKELAQIKKTQEMQAKLYDLLYSSGILNSPDPKQKIQELYNMKSIKNTNGLSKRSNEA